MIGRVLVKAGGRGLALKALLGMLVVALCAVPAMSSAAASSSGPTPPSQDPFYTYGGSLTGIAPGTILKQRQVTIVDQGHALPNNAGQVLYRTTDELGQPTITVATVIRPRDTSGPNASKIVSYQTAYDALGSQCDPSYTLRGGNASATGIASEERLMLAYVDAGYTAVIPDYESVQLAWGAGHESGYGTLDGITAAENLLRLPARTTPVALVGYSGGATATEFATELAPSYDSALHIVGAAEGGLSVYHAHTGAYINGSKDYSGLIPAVLVGVARAFNLNLANYETAYGQSITQQISNDCLNNLYGAYPGLTEERLVQQPYHDLYSVSQFAQINNEQIMGSAGTPTEPLMIGVGDYDGTGDGLAVTGDNAGLATTYCERGVSVEFKQYNGDDHAQAQDPFESDALAFLKGLLSGGRPVSNCGSFEHGNSLTPLPTGRTNLRFRYIGPNKRSKGVVIELRTRHGRLRNLSFQLRQQEKAVRTLSLHLTTHWRRIVLKVSGAMPPAGYYTLTVTHNGKKMLLYRMLYFT